VSFWTSWVWDFPHLAVGTAEFALMWWIVSALRRGRRNAQADMTAQTEVQAGAHALQAGKPPATHQAASDAVAGLGNWISLHTAARPRSDAEPTDVQAALADLWAESRRYGAP
jgi:hypothetical protein